MPKLLEDKVAIVTGGSQGLGKAAGTALAVDGARVLLVARREEELDAAAADIRAAGGEAETFPADLTRPEAAVEVVRAARERLGGVDALVNCAGVFLWQKFFDLAPEDWDRTLATNLSAPFLLTQEAARAMADRGRGGSIINIASIHGVIGDPNVVAHCASKFGLVGLTKACAEALREHDIRVNAIAPGAIDPASAERRGASPKHKVTQADIATLVVYLASDLARSITGSVIDMPGNTRAVIKT